MELGIMETAHWKKLTEDRALQVGLVPLQVALNNVLSAHEDPKAALKAEMINQTSSEFQRFRPTYLVTHVGSQYQMPFPSPFGNPQTTFATSLIH